MFFNKKEKPYIIPPSYFRGKGEDKQEKPKDKEDGKSSI